MTENTTLTAEEDNNYGMFGTSPTYSTARSTYTNKSQYDTFWIGQTRNYYGSNYYRVNRGFLTFDLSSLSDITVTSATLYLTGSANDSVVDFYIEVRGYTQSSITLNNAGYNAYGTSYYGRINSSDYSSTSDGMSISLDSSGVSYINDKLGGDCILSLVSSEDVANSAPTTDNFEAITVYSPESLSARVPHLYLEYEAAGSAWTPKIMMIMKPLADGFLEWIKKPLQQDMYLQI